MRRLPTVLLIVGLTAVTAGCLTLMPVGSHFQRGTDFTRYQTYAWGPADALPISDQRLRENPGVAAEQRSELIVLGVPGRHLAGFGSTTIHIVREENCPVLTVRA